MTGSRAERGRSYSKIFFQIIPSMACSLQPCLASHDFPTAHSEPEPIKWVETMMTSEPPTKTVRGNARAKL